MVVNTNPMPHDAFFKISMAQPEIIKDLIHTYLPQEIVARLDLNKLVLAPVKTDPLSRVNLYRKRNDEWKRNINTAAA